MKLTTSELVYINEAAKALKQKDIVIIDNAMIGLDNIQNIVSYTLLDNNFFINHFNGIIINQRELTSFIKTISIESDFEIEFIGNIASIKTISGGELLLKFDKAIAELACNNYRYVASLAHNSIESKIPDIAYRLQSMNKTDGAIIINHEGYQMTIFPSILPINKSDELYISIIDSFNYNTFVARYRIKKKKFDIITYVNYLKI